MLPPNQRSSGHTVRPNKANFGSMLSTTVQAGVGKQACSNNGANHSGVGYTPGGIYYKGSAGTATTLGAKNGNTLPANGNMAAQSVTRVRFALSATVILCSKVTVQAQGNRYC